MIFLLSPSKTMKKKTTAKNEVVAADSYILSKLKSLSKNDIKILMKVSDAIAEKTYLQFQNFIEDSIAIYSYTGLQYQQLKLDEYTKEELNYMEKHIKIVSALYGIVNSFDTIGLYRLEMNTKFIDLKLSDYWCQKNKIDSDVIVVLTSDEYYQAVKLNKNIVRIYFMDYIQGELKISKKLKICRGLFIHECIKNNVNSIKALKKIVVNGYEFAECSTSKQYYYVKKEKI